MAKQNYEQANAISNNTGDMDTLQALMLMSGSFQQGQSPPYLLPMPGLSAPTPFYFPPQQQLFATAPQGFFPNGSIVSGNPYVSNILNNNRNAFLSSNDLVPMVFMQTQVEAGKAAALNNPVSVPAAGAPQKKKKTKKRKAKRKQEPRELCNVNVCEETAPSEENETAVVADTKKAASGIPENEESDDYVVYTIEQAGDRPAEKVAVSRKRAHESGSTEQPSTCSAEQQAKQRDSSLLHFPEPRAATGDASSGFILPTFDNNTSSRVVNNLDVDLSGWLKLWNHIEDKVTTSILLRVGGTSNTQTTVQQLFREFMHHEQLLDVRPARTKRSKK